MNTDNCVPKLTGADIELANFVEGTEDRFLSVSEASGALLAQIRADHGLPARILESDKDARTDPQDRGRTFLPTSGACCYIDLDHLEVAIPETLSAFDHVACIHALFQVASNAQRALNASRPPGARVQVLANNSDGDVSYGGHLNVMLSRTAWDNIVHRRSHYMAHLAAFQVSSLPLTGQGKVGAANGAPWVPFQLSQRADYFETIAGPQTTMMRPLVNTRDEPLCGRWWERTRGYGRLHSIFFDTTLCEGSSVLRVGTMQLVLAAMEAGVVDARLALDDPLTAVRTWSHDPTLTATAALVSGEEVTALQLQRRFMDAVAPLVSTPDIAAMVPRAAEILALWDDTLSKLESGDWTGLSRRLDWVLKLSIMERAMRARPDLRWDSAELRVLDQLYGSLDHSAGLYWSLADRGLVETFTQPGAADLRLREPPADTRAWGRAMLLRRAGNAVEDVDWDVVRVRLGDGSGSWRVDMNDPLGSSEADLGALWREGSGLQDLLLALGATPEAPQRRGGSTGSYGLGYWPVPAGTWSAVVARRPATDEHPSKRGRNGSA